MPRSLSVEFAFDIGEMVTHKTMLGAESAPLKFLVVEQLTQRCSGGTQLFYLVDAIGMQGQSITTNLHLREDALVLYPSAEELAAAATARDVANAEREERAYQQMRARAEKRKAQTE